MADAMGTLVALLSIMLTLVSLQGVTSHGNQPLSRIAIHKTVLSIDVHASINATPPVLGVNGQNKEWVFLEYSISNPSVDDWIGVFSPGNFSAASCLAETPRTFPPFLCTAPIKYQHANYSSPHYKNTGKGSLKLQLINQRSDFSFALFSGGLFSPKLVAVSNIVSFANPDAPVYPRLAQGKAWNEVHNTCLLKKWLWRYNFEEGAMWRELITQKYGKESCWITKESPSPFGCSVWKTIRKLWPDFSQSITIKIGNGEKTSFWYDNWLDQGNAKTKFQTLFELSLQKQDLVCQVRNAQGWSLQFRRNLNDWEIDLAAEFLQRLDQLGTVTQEEDKMRWKHSRKGVFTVKNAYKEINQNQTLIELWPWKLIWRTKAPFKVACFVWLVVKKACLTHEVLQRKGFQICSRCSLCGESQEDNAHLFLHCRTTTNLWNMFLYKLGTTWTMPATTMECLIGWNMACNREDDKGSWRMVPACI